MTAPTRRSPTTMSRNELVTEVRRQAAQIEELETALGFYAFGAPAADGGALARQVLRAGKDGGALARQVLRAGKDGD